MNTPDELEQFIIKANNRALITFLMQNQYLCNEFICPSCGSCCKLVVYRKNVDGFAWRCLMNSCPKFRSYYSLRKNSFFDGLNIKMQYVLRILIKYGCRQTRHSIKTNLNISDATIVKVIKKLIGLIPPTDFFENKLGGPGCIVQIDETMLNFKCKSHRGRSPENRTDSLCIVEYNGNIKRVFAQIIPNKE
ncbi:hypothetical protein H312_01597 [Anncaliia algerae PRA339]|uniref:ISXO2-like transposase domain-containing protein n=1 Tax=Anncaliia algerae PRA339 TaxID=1288291 RepID=A0A059F1L5_9MICR|nr:hypothetical protein H312_01597 [Anncaliia algerae PRA339]